MRSSLGRESVARTFSTRLEEMLCHSGEVGLLRLREDARETAGPLGLPKEFQRLDTLIGTFLGTRDAPLESPMGIRRAAGLPYDLQRLDVFQRFLWCLARTPASRCFWTWTLGSKKRSASVAIAHCIRRPRASTSPNTPFATMATVFAGRWLRRRRHATADRGRCRWVRGLCFSQ